MDGAVPFGFSTLNLSGKFILNKTLSDDTDTILQLQGIGWITRSAISYASVTFEIKHTREEDGTEHMQLDEYTTTGGLATTTEVRALVWKEAEHEDVVFGSVLAKARRCREEEVPKEPFLAHGWTAQTTKDGLIQSYIRSNTRKSGLTWVANEVWGVEEINGRKRFTRRVHFTAQRKVITARLVYDYTW